jgi:hypothetical protein
MSLDWFSYLLDLIVAILFLPLATRLSNEWFKSFDEWQEYEKQRMSEIENLYERIGEWKEVADRIERREHPYNSSDTQKMGAFVHTMITQLEGELTRLIAEDLELK